MADLEITGDASGCTGDMSGCGGDMTGCSGDMTGCSGDFTAMTGDFTDCSGDFSGCSGDFGGCALFATRPSEYPVGETWAGEDVSQRRGDISHLAAALKLRLHHPH